jgi:hypothetical protein
MKTQYLAIGPHGWARADRQDDALQQCIGHIAYWENLDLVPFEVYRCHKSTYVNQMGDVCWTKGKPKPVKITEHKIPPKAIRTFKEAQGGLEYNFDTGEEYYTYCEE